MQVHTRVHAPSNEPQILDIDQRIHGPAPGLERTGTSVGTFCHDHENILPGRTGAFVLADVTSAVRSLIEEQKVSLSLAVELSVVILSCR